MHIEELLDEEVTALAGECYARKDPSVAGRRHGSNPGTVGLPASACRFACPGCVMCGERDSAAVVRGVAW